MRPFKKFIAEWTTLEAIAREMAGQYPYYFLVAHRGEEKIPRLHGYEIANEEDEECFLRCLSKELVYKGMKQKPEWWP